ncbi:hypothetical protein BH24ACI2_BH24ACI2_04760 [soil metagenome]|jgi:hypothetical protein|nr:hypothetical protein [Acidobacteriota bacterium]
MKTLKINHGIILGLFVTLMFCLFIPQTVFCQTEKLGIVQYTPPSGWTKTPKENMVAFSDIKQTGQFCIITLYGATAGTGTPNGDFTREWQNLVVRIMKAEANPTPDIQSDDGWTILSGGSPVVADTGKALAFLTVISGFGNTVSVLAVFNDPAYAKQVDAFIGAIEMGKPAAPANNTTTAAAPPTLDSDGKLVIPPLARHLTVADLAGEWEENSGLISTQYVYRDTGSYAGSDHLAYRNKMKIDKNGGYTNDFFEVRNGKALRDITTGTVTIVGRVLTIKGKDATKYVIRGWLELPDMTVLKVVGPWYNDQEIPENIFTNPKQGENLATIWVRKK